MQERSDDRMRVVYNNVADEKYSEPGFTLKADLTRLDGWFEKRIHQDQVTLIYISIYNIKN